MHPDRVAGSLLGLVTAVLSLALAGCAGTPGNSRDESPTQSPVLAQLAVRLPGQYVSVREAGRPAQELRIERVSGEPGRELELRLTQQGDGQTPPRIFGLRLTATRIATRLQGRLALLDSNGASRRSCPMTFQAGEQGVVGETDPRQCVFGEGDDALGLIKEMMFDGSQLTIADRLVDPATGDAQGSDQIITFLPQPTFEAWAGHKEGDGWRVAEPFSLSPGQGTQRPKDAADMPLGFDVTLDYYRMDRVPESILLRLTVRDADSGQLLGETWSAPDSERLGLALPETQIGLERSTTR